MSKNSILISQDLLMIREIMSLSQQELADALGVEFRTLERWENNETSITNYNMEKIYSFAYQNSISLNAIKESQYKEEYTEDHQIILFHGAKDIIDGEISIAKSKVNNDFGQGFYCGETMEQSSLFVSNFANSSIYILKVGTQNLNHIRYNVDQDWMLTIAYFRGRLDPYKDTQKVRELKNKVEQCDFILAPIADNRMFQIIDSFIEGDLTDEQCKHCLAATNLGYQYVFRTKQALQQLDILERCYLCQAEKDKYKEKRKSDTKISEDKIKIAKIQYRGKGHYIDEVLS